jgi:pimeloyl-ACP methyl ester carboxylesterase
MQLMVPTSQRAARHRTPVVLVHGYGSNRSAWYPLEQRLLRSGFAHVDAVSYNAGVMDLPEIAHRVVHDCARAMERARTDQVHLVGHSLGGVVVRYTVARLGLAPHVRTAVTVATPHGGTALALCAGGHMARSLGPGSWLLRELQAITWPSGVRWINYYSDLDLIVRPDSARVRGRDQAAQDIRVQGAGHVGILRAPAFLDSVVAELVESYNRLATGPAKTGEERLDRFDGGRTRELPAGAGLRMPGRPVERATIA